MGYGNEEKEYNCGLCTFMFSPHLWLMFILGLYIYVCIYTHTYVYIYAYIYIYIHIIVVQIQLSPFSSHHNPPPRPSLPPNLKPTPLWLCPCVLYTCSLMTLPLLSLSPLLSGYCQFVLYFNVFGCILLACLFC